MTRETINLIGRNLAISSELLRMVEQQQRTIDALCRVQIAMYEALRPGSTPESEPPLAMNSTAAALELGKVRRDIEELEKLFRLEIDPKRD